MDRVELPYWIALSRIRGVRRPLVKDLLDRILKGELRIRDVFDGGASGIAPALQRALKAFKAWKAVERELGLAEKKGVNILTFADEGYPPLLRHIYDPPVILYAKGGFDASSAPAVAVVGTRRPSPYGLRMSETIARDLASLGVAVVSGMARGCDTAAHRGALSAGGRTIAVLGSGVDVVYPAENRTLYNEIVDKGLVLSEYPITTPPIQYNFPRRNRIISGIASGVLVAEAPLRSGAMSTARLALSENREVFAVPGAADSEKAAGTNSLIKEGALLVSGAEDILAELGIKPSSRPRRTQAPPAAVGKEEGLVLELIQNGPLHIDSIIERSGLTPAKAASVLLELELKGLVEQRPGKVFVRGLR